MSTPISLFDYHLPPERIAQHSVTPRDQSRLLVLHRQTGEREHKVFKQIVDELRAGDVLVFNNTKVFKARWFGMLGQVAVEVFLVRAHGTVWETLVKPGRKVAVKDVIRFGQECQAVVKEKLADGRVMLDFGCAPEVVMSLSETLGEIPTPPYVSEKTTDVSKYQTVYARETGSVAAPTAGFHFTDELLATLRERGVQQEFVTLHVGIGTFRPVKTETLEEHQMHAEWVSLSPETATRINQAKREGRRVIAVGTTTVRVLEGIALRGDGQPLSDTGFEGDVNLFIQPGFTFRVIDGLVTNFHLPKSTLLVLVSAFAGREHVLSAYQEAIEKEYRFYSFGDAMFIR